MGVEGYGDPAVREAVARRIGAAWGLELPVSYFRFLDFLAALGPVERRALRDLDLAPCGVTDLFADPGAVPRDGLDLRTHGRYYRDPPEFLTFLHGGSDGLHFGLWSDDGRTCTGVGSYRNDDGEGIDLRHRTPLEAVRARVEAAQRDLAEYAADGDEEEKARLAGLGALRGLLTEFETAERTETGAAYAQAYDGHVPAVDPRRITTLDGAGALVSGKTALDRPPHNAADAYRFATFVEQLFDDPVALRNAREEALRRAAAGDPAEALVLGRDLHQASYGNREREDYAGELLALAYRALDRPALAGIAEAHHRHRSLPSVDVLRRG
ncbi:hypothetical protein [Streptomyces sp. NPDC053755]|uniref:hypothetical protein n=1 Tax=Streptomyces sp. NPDC053755 TaxID=3155815 RepID=UPI00342F2B70